MSQRNPMNDRYTADKLGQTRKSAASAKPKSTRAATLRDPAPKTRKQKKQEQREREQKQQQRVNVKTEMRYEDTPEYKRLRRVWWGFLAVAILCTVLSSIVSFQSGDFFKENPDGLFLGFLPSDSINTVSISLIVCAYAFIIIAFYVDFWKIRKKRKEFQAMLANDNSKEMRKNQKKARAEQREKEREAAERAKLEAENPQPKKQGFFARFKKDAKKEEAAIEKAAENVPAETAADVIEETV